VSFTTWTPHAVSSEAFAWQAQVRRMVESQHIAATMKLVDNLDEQDLLETLLESSKPAQPGGTAGLDYLLATPVMAVSPNQVTLRRNTESIEFSALRW
jgi:hypothetical protein